MFCRKAEWKQKKHSRSKRPSLYYVSKKAGWAGLKMAIFADVQYYIHADIVSGWVIRSEKVPIYADVI